MGIKRSVKKMWTKSEIKMIAELWEKTTSEELCSKLKITQPQLMYITMSMRKHGLDLPKKHKMGYTANLIKECKLELGR